MKKSYKRIISAVLAIVLFTSNFPVLTQAGSGFSIACEGETVSQVEFYANEKLTVSAENLPGGSYQWQINIPGTDQWVNIQGQTGQTLNLTYALLGSLMDGSRSASVRCAAMNGSEAIEYSDPLRATVLEEVAKVQPMSFMPENIGNVLPEATVPETAEPAETVPVIPEATIPEETWPFVPGETEPVIPETTAPAETEPVVPETTAPAETEPVVVPETTAPAETEATLVSETTVPAETEPVLVASSASAVPEVVIFEEAQSSTEPPMALEVTPVTEPQILEPVIVSETTVPVETEPVVVPETTAPAETEPVVVPETTAPAETEPVVVPETTAPAETEAVIFSTSQDSVSMNQAEAPSPVAEEDFVDVTIKYIYWDRLQDKEGDQTWDPYVAHIQSGSDFSAIVRNKVVPAYKTEISVPDHGPDDTIKLVADETGSTLYNPDLHTTSYVSLDLKNVTQNIVITVYYIEIQVPYSARYYLQNPYNDLYTEKTNVLDAPTIAQMKGFKGEDPRTDLIYPAIPGFSVLFHQPETIAADGSTVFEVYYDRNYYLINFDLNGGFGTAPVYARYDTGFTVSKPTRPGYSFAGWELVSGTVPENAEKNEDGLVKKIHADNLTYKAKWTTGTTSYGVIYWTENANPETDGTYKYSFWTSDTITNVPSGSEVSAANFATATFTDSAYFTYNSGKSMEEEIKNPDYDASKGKVIVNGDGSTILNVYFTRKSYELRFLYAKATKGTNNTEKINLIYLNNTGVIGKDGSWWNNPETYHSDVNTLPEIRNPDNIYTLGSEYIDTPQGNYKYWYLSFTAKYNADISNLWPAAVVGNVPQVNNSGNPTNKIYRWGSWGTQDGCAYRERIGQHANIVGSYPILSKEMIINPNDEIAQRLIAWWPNADADNVTYHAYHIYIEALDQNAPNTVEGPNGVKYLLDRTQILTCAHNGDTRVDNFNYDGLNFIAENGVDYNNSSKHLNNNKCSLCDQAETTFTPVINCEYHTNFYYLRDRTKSFTIQNLNAPLVDRNGVTQTYTGLPFGTNLSGYEISKEDMDEYYYPENLEANAYTFDDWYTTGNCLPGTNVTWSNLKMPSSDLTVYANWIPVTYDVFFYRDYDQLMKDVGKTDAQLEAEALRSDASSNFFQCRLDTDHGKAMITEQIPASDKKPAFPALQQTLPDENNKRFVQWFYLDDEGQKVAFNPGEMAVRRNMRLYAEWTSSNSVEYEVNYLLGEQNGTAVSPAIPLADMTTGYGFESTTRTFQAKGVDQLNLLNTIPETTLNEYKVPEERLEDMIWLPNTSSHSILLKAPEPDPSNPGTTVNPNTYDFVYVARKYAPYEVRYVDKETGSTLQPTDKYPENTNAVVTEEFEYIPGYIPDTFYKRLVLSANTAENVITFYYTKDDAYVPGVGGGGTPSAGTSLYLIKHMVQSAEDPGVFEEFTSEEGTKPINTEIKATELNDPHFELIPETGFQYTYEDGTTSAPYKNTDSGTVTTDGLVLTLYYTRKQFDYVVKFIERDTKNELKYKETQSDGTVVEKPYTYRSQGMYQAVVEAKSVVIPGYGLYRSDEDTNIETDANGNIILKKTLKIGSDTAHNVITFEYYALPVTINYHVITADANNGTCVEKDVGGFTTIPKEEASSTKAVTGAQAVPRTGYQFMGWFSDDQCQNRITGANWLSTDGRYLTPQVSFTDDVYDYDYYAKFEPITLTIRQTGVASTDSGVYTIVNGTGTPALSMTVIISGNDSVTIEQIPAGSYTVTETSWAWKYSRSDEQTKPVNVEANADNAVTFAHSGGDSCWLNGEDS